MWDADQVTQLSAALAAVVVLLAAAAGLLPSRFGVPVLAVIVGGFALLGGVDGFPASLLGPVCAFLVVACARLTVSDRRRSRELLAEVKAAQAAITKAAVLDERARIAREIHDVLSHSTSSLLLQLQAARALLDDDATDRALPMLDRAIGLAREALREAGDVARALRGEEGLIGDLSEELRALIRIFTETTGVRCSAVLALDSVELLSLTRVQDLAIYRTVQEGLTNIARHNSNADHVVVELRNEQRGVVLEVHDHRPHDAPPPAARLKDDHRPRHGLIGLAERARAAGGTLSVDQCPDGFRLRLVLPLVANAAELPGPVSSTGGVPL